MYSVQPIVDRDTTVQPIVERGTHCTAYNLLRTEISLYNLLWKDTVQPIVERDITVQPIVERDTHCTMYSLLWTEMITVQPIVERDTHCTVYSLLWTEMITVQLKCGKRYSLYSLQPIVERDDHCTANCGKRGSLYSQLWKEMITILTKARHEPHTQPTQCQRNCSPVATHSASSPHIDYPPQPQFLHQSSAPMASPPDLTDPGDESLSVPASHNPRVLHRSRSDTRLVLGRHSSLDRTASPP